MVEKSAQVPSRKSSKFQKELQDNSIELDPAINIDEYTSFSEHLKSSTRILALIGAGLSAASGIPTFRGAGGFWREHDVTDLASPEGFYRNPSLVWQFYNYRRHQALKAMPNRAHVALARLAKQKPGFLAITQNIDGLSEQANHPPSQLERIHGSLFEIRCTNRDCDFQETNFTDPIVPALQLPEDQDIGDVNFPLREVPREELPHCPKCTDSLLRPGIVLFGEAVPQPVTERIGDWLDQGQIDLMLAIGTTAIVYPAAGYIHIARVNHARVAVVDMEPKDGDDVQREQDGDWFFQGDASVIVPELLKEVIGRVP
ncbi:silent information regulator protein Sir2p [Mytilinidion resinicola]|uniref:Silent information regulator protein Sir2p n=1 Tax=Mytilinidion resinicola TaxID=574789 RepID=A0A6A6Z749_9PEZI|nr:silent information regulator protein Sir2p [Mytilinidion resinicola]KAF2816075.1 silent information regulator protein Sir2p [Mytilinidion resinicola]